ncbi:hypothetical protein [Tautonia sociabilis]|uniref:Uncharacterized protein n=1 Tax=Tautonia sociabilis TaxID=2080755 RepID=A0A432MQ53_9BACT|nr:hypothetical protein [Tautonia sociabilis]RUL89604.1 hypothetical protein TsocGM_00065 [Tautonia sociabilis]
MSRLEFHFRGVPEFVDAESEKAGRPELAGAARRVPALGALATLCAQAVEAAADGRPASDILRQAADFRDQLRIAADAADAMLSAVSRGCDADWSLEHGPRPAGASSRGTPRRRRPEPGSGANDES